MPGPALWIESQLGFKQQEALIDWILDRSTDPTGELIREGITELFPHKKAPSKQACRRWKAVRWQGILLHRRLKEIVASAKMVVPDDDTALDEAIRVALKAFIFEQLQLGQDGKPGEIGLAEIKELTRCITALSRSGREAKESESRLLDAKRKRKAEDEAKAKAAKKMTLEEREAKLKEIYGW